MAIFHATTKPISRSKGRSATASSAYRAGCEIEDKRTGLTHDYSKKKGVMFAQAYDKDLNEIDRSELWNLAESSEKRKDSRTAREWILAIPNELMEKDPNDGLRAVQFFSKQLAEKYNLAFDMAVHEPDKEGDNRNYHAHIMTTTRELIHTENGISLGDKTTLELSNTKRKKLGLGTTANEIKELRKLWATVANHYLEKQGHDARIDHRSLAEQGIDRKPTIKLGWQTSEMERRGIKTERGDYNRLVKLDAELKDLRQQSEKSDRFALPQTPTPTPTQQATADLEEAEPHDTRHLNSWANDNYQNMILAHNQLMQRYKNGKGYFDLLDRASSFVNRSDSVGGNIEDYLRRHGDTDKASDTLKHFDKMLDNVKEVIDRKGLKQDRAIVEGIERTDTNTAEAKNNLDFTIRTQSAPKSTPRPQPTQRHTGGLKPPKPRGM